MSATNGKPRGRPPHRHSKAELPKPGDEQATYTHVQLIRMADIDDAQRQAIVRQRVRKRRGWRQRAQQYIDQARGLGGCQAMAGG